MTSIVKVSQAHNIFEQVKWKCKAYSSTFSTVLIIHILFGLLTFDNGSGSIGRGNGFIEYNESFYSLDAMYIFSIITLLIIGWILASKPIFQENFSIVATNQTETISSLLFIVVLSLFTFISAMSTLSLTIFIKLFQSDEILFLPVSFFSFSSFMIFLTSTVLACSIGYFTRILFHYSKVALVLLGIALFLFMRMKSYVTMGELFFQQGDSWLDLVGKCSLYIAVIWTCIILLKQRKEVIRG